MTPALAPLAARRATVGKSQPLRIEGRVAALGGMTIEAVGLPLPTGTLCRVDRAGGWTRQDACRAEVVGFDNGRTLLMPLSDVHGVAAGDAVYNECAPPQARCGPHLLGRVIDGFGDPLDGRGPVAAGEMRPLDAPPPSPLQRTPIRKAISTGVRAIDGLLTCGTGQRMGLFAGPGVGKSTLLASVSKNSDADVSVIALIGERGREVQEFIEHGLGPDGLARCVVVVSTAEDPPTLKVRAAKLACTLAESFRDRGQDVLLLMDSLTRLCQAQRQIGLAAREPPATKGYPPSVFALLPRILERAGAVPGGSVTGFYTVLVEGDDFNEPVPDAVKGITDGHIWLGRKLAEAGHFPAIDVLRSISRVRGDVCDKAHADAARRIQKLLADYEAVEDLISIGAYVPGHNPAADVAVACRPSVLNFLQQAPDAPTDLASARKQLAELVLEADLVAKTPARPHPR